MEKGRNEFVFSLGFVRGYIARIERDPESLKWFQARGVDLLDLKNLAVAIEIVSTAFYGDKDEKDPK